MENWLTSLSVLNGIKKNSTGAIMYQQKTHFTAEALNWWKGAVYV